MQTIYIDCAGVKSAADFWQRYIDTARPADADLFGRNLDAFWDAIEAAGPGWPGEVKLVFKHSSQCMRSVKTRMRSVKTLQVWPEIC